MTPPMFDVGPLYAAHRDSRKKIDVSQGGTGSGKTYSIIQYLYTLAIENSRLRVTVVGQDVPNLKRGAFRDAETIFGKSEYLQHFFTLRKGDRVLTGKNGSFIEFVSYEDEQDAKSGKRDVLFVNEGDGISWEIFQQLYWRTEIKTIVDYNPTLLFWAHEKLIPDRSMCNLFISDHRHNPFMSAEQHAKIEGIEDPELWKVYARGLTGKIAGLVLRNWSIVDRMPANCKKGPHFGLDFGFTVDPTALVDVRLSEGKIWVHCPLYQKGLTNPQIVEKLVEQSIRSDAEIIADSAEEKSIAEIRSMGYHRIEGANKGPDSVRIGLDILKRYHICVTADSVDLIDEFRKYRWMKDKNGKPLGKPIDMFNHGIDALRYVMLNRYTEKPRGQRRATIGSFNNFPS